MPSNKQEYLSDALFSESEHPSRVYIMLVETSAYLGSYTKSPFHFGRKWTVETTASLMSMPSFHHVENTYLKNALDEMKTQMLYLIKMNEQNNEETSTDIDSSDSEPLSEKKKRRVTRKQTKTTGKAAKKTKGKGKKPVKNSQEPIQSTSRFWNPFAKYPQADNDNQSLASSFVVLEDPSVQPAATEIQRSPVEDTPVTPIKPAATPVKTTYWLTKCQLELNSAPLNQVIK